VGAVIDLGYKLLRPGAHPPAKTRPGDAAFDLRVDESFVLAPGGRRRASTGIAVAIPDGMAGLVLPRSGLADRHGITLLNTPGLIDPNYRGEVGLIVHNAGSSPYEVHAGDRVAQLLVVPVASVGAVEVDELPPTSDDRGEQGFGSSGR
jgi:dUTP pyrophosphatase